MFYFSSSVLGSDNYYYYDTLNDDYFRGRTTSSLSPNDEVIYSPFTQQNNTWLNQIMVDDDDQTLEQVRQTLQNWQQMEEFSRMWNLESTGLYQTPPDGEKVNYLSKNMIRYIDKRIAGEVKNAKDGSTLKNIGQIQEALRPGTQVNISKDFKIKMRMQVLQGQASFQLQNPWIGFVAEGTASGKLKVCFDKNFSNLGGQAEVKYEYPYDKWTASYEQLITSYLKARFSSEKIGKLSFGEQAQQNFQFIYWRPF